MDKIEMHPTSYNSGINVVTFDVTSCKLKIGKFCSIGAGLTVFLNGNHRTDWITTYPFGSIRNELFPSQRIHVSSNENMIPHKNVIIENEVWIGRNVTIMPGVTIGNGAIIACNSHVVKDVPPFTVYGGNPAKFIKFRFDEEIIEKLLKIKWWD